MSISWVQFLPELGPNTVDTTTTNNSASIVITTVTTTTTTTTTSNNTTQCPPLADSRVGVCKW